MMKTACFSMADCDLNGNKKKASRPQVQQKLVKGLSIETDKASGPEPECASGLLQAGVLEKYLDVGLSGHAILARGS